MHQSIRLLKQLLFWDHRSHGILLLAQLLLAIPPRGMVRMLLQAPAGLHRVGHGDCILCLLGIYLLLYDTDSQIVVSVARLAVVRCGQMHIYELRECTV